MAVQPKYTVEDFETFLELPENIDLNFEYIHGEVVEKEPTNARASALAAQIGSLLWNFVLEKGIEGHITGANGGYKISDRERYIPNIAYLPASKQEELDNKGYFNSVPPDLVIEVETNTTQETERRLRRKTAAYLSNGILLWVVYPEIKEIEVCSPDGAILTLGIEDTLTGGNVLPGFALPVKDIFGDLY
jgi:Uma2 family endonuclease